MAIRSRKASDVPAGTHLAGDLPSPAAGQSAPSRIGWTAAVPAAGLLLMAAGPLAANHGSAGNADLHGALELVGAVFASIVGAAMIVWFRNLGSRLYLLVGLGFVANGTEDLVHGWLALCEPYSLPLSPWAHAVPATYAVGRVLLAAFTIAGLYAAGGRPSRNPRREGLVAALAVLVSVAVVALVAFLVPLPAVVFPAAAIPRPLDFACTLLFFIALVGYLRRYHAGGDSLTWWLALSLAVHAVSAAAMSCSRALYDPWFDLAHVYKILGYAVPVLGFSLHQTVLLKERIAAERSLRESEARARSIAASAQDAIIMIDERGAISFWNEAATRIFGYPAHEALGADLHTLIVPPQYRAPYQAVFRRFFETGEGGAIGKTVELHGLRKDGSEFPVELSLSAVNENGRWRGIGIVRDISDRKQELRNIKWLLTKGLVSDATAHEAYAPPYGDLTALNTDGLILKSVGHAMLRDIVGDYLDLLDTSAAVYEKNGDYALGIFSSGWCRFLDEASRKLSGDVANQQALRCGRWRCHESCWTNASKVSIASGEPVDVECSGGIRLYAVPIRAGGAVVGSINFGYGDPPRDLPKLQEVADKNQVPIEELRRYAEAYPSRPPFIVELAKKRLQISARLIGEIVNRKQAEEALARLNGELEQRVEARTAELRHSQRMEAVGLLAGGIAHEFNNLLQAIEGYTTYALEGLSPKEPRYGDLNTVLEATHRAAALTRQLLGFSRRRTLQPRSLDPNEVLADVAKLIRPVIGEHNALEIVRGEGLGTVYADAGELHQVLLNLCLNARDAMPSGGNLLLKTQRVFLSEPSWDYDFQTPPGDYVVFTVTDTGCGMAPEVRQRIFEPFFTTKGVGRGTGLGLAMVYGIVQQHKGAIHVYSEPGRGSTFKVYLPSQDNEQDVERPVTAGVTSTGTETILLAEDDPMVRDLAVRALQRGGYTVLAACDGEEALRLFQERRREIALVILDAIMPKLTGHEVYRCIRAEDDEVKVLFCTGYDPETAQSQVIREESLRIVEKPFDADTLRQAVREVLDEREPSELLMETNA